MYITLYPPFFGGWGTNNATLRPPPEMLFHDVQMPVPVLQALLQRFPILYLMRGFPVPRPVPHALFLRSFSNCIHCDTSLGLQRPKCCSTLFKPRSLSFCFIFVYCCTII